MTREPDGYEAKAREIIAAAWKGDLIVNKLAIGFAAALHREREEAQSRTAMLAAGIVRGLTSPSRGEINGLARQIQDLAAAPAAEPSKPVAPANEVRVLVEPCEVGGHYRNNRGVTFHPSKCVAYSKEPRKP